MTQPDAFLLAANDWVPNNARLPVLVYRAAIEADRDDPAAAFERAFAANGWPPEWRDGIFDYHHFHSTAHEVLGVSKGRATVILGGPDGRKVDIAAGDVVVLPAGTGHCLDHADDDFEVVGAYPAGQKWDICRHALTPDALRKMLALPMPDQDPVSGRGGPLCQEWDERGKQML
jgi:uncharacterized protein YjlB